MDDFFDPTSFLGILNIVLTIATFLLPVLLRMRKKAKRKQIDENYTIAHDSKYWLDATGTITKFEFTRSRITVSPKQAKKKIYPPEICPLASVDYVYRDVPHTALVYVGDGNYEIGQQVNIKFDPSKFETAIIHL